MLTVLYFFFWQPQVIGPFFVEATNVFVPGAVAATVFVAGAEAAAVGGR